MTVMTALAIEYQTCETPLGRLFVAATPGGLCSVRFSGALAGESALRRAYPGVTLMAASSRRLQCYVERVVALLADAPELSAASEMALDTGGTDFQQQVWRRLRQIPRGETCSYSQLAARLGRPSAARAVASACAANPVALVTPCHRVVPQCGGVGGYAYGTARKRALLELEGGTASPRL